MRFETYDILRYGASVLACALDSLPGFLTDDQILDVR